MSCAVDLRFRVKVSQRRDSKLNKLPYQFVGPENHAKVSVAASINVCRIPSASLLADSVPTVKSALVDASRSRQPRPAPRVSALEGVVARCAASPLRCQDRASEAQRASGEGRRGSAVAVHTRREPTTHENEQVREQTETRLAKPGERARASGDYTAHRHCRN